MPDTRMPNGTPLMAIVFALPLGESILQYIDPGSGSLVLQAVIGAVAAVLVAMAMFWKQLKAFVAGLFSRSRNNGKPRER